jgi:hypothetical protein
MEQAKAGTNDWLIIVWGYINPKVGASGLITCYKKGDIVDILPLGICPGKKCIQSPIPRYGKILSKSWSQVMFLKDISVSLSILDADGQPYFKEKRKNCLSKSFVDGMSKDWTKPTLIELGSVQIAEKV